MYNKSSNLWCKVLRSKYNILDSKDCLRFNPNASSLWKDVVKNFPIMMKTGGWVVGDGKNITQRKIYG